MKKLALTLLALGFVASAAAIPAHAQAMQNQADENHSQDIENRSDANSTDVERGPVESSQKPVRRGPPAFVQDLIPEHALQNMPDFFW